MVTMPGGEHWVDIRTSMEDLQLARLAGEAFSFITGLDLAYLDLDRNLRRESTSARTTIQTSPTLRWTKTTASRGPTL
jgi:hypothetical protein